MQTMDLWNTHTAFDVWLVTATPDGVRPSSARGWCYRESSAALMLHTSCQVLDLGKYQTGDEGWARTCTAGRRPPLLPQRFVEELGKKCFT